MVAALSPQRDTHGMDLGEVQAAAALAYAPDSPNPVLIKPLEVLGDGAFLFTAFKALDAGDSDTARFCLEAGLLFEKQTVYKSRIRNLLLEDYAKLGRHEDVLRLINEAAQEGNNAQKILKARALLGLGRYDEAFYVWTELQKTGTGTPQETEAALIECLTKLDAPANQVLISKKVLTLLDSPRSAALTLALEIGRAHV